MSYRKLFQLYRKKHKKDDDTKEKTSSLSNDEECIDLSGDFDRGKEGPEQPKQLQAQISQSEFTCGCCFELMVDPTTLTCGHNFCRLCVARWFLTSKKSECPTCRQTYSGNPQINITLRSATETLFGDQYRERKRQLAEDPANEQVLVDFHTAMSSGPTWWKKQQYRVNRRSLIKGVIIASAAFLAWVTLRYFFSGSNIALRPVMKWSQDDVSLWLQELGPWTEDELLPTFQRHHIDGHLLMALTEMELEELLQFVSPLHQRAFLHSLYSLRELGIKPPINIWEYKNMHLGRSMFLLFMLRNNPRLTMLYVLLFEYTDCFLPFIHVTSPALEDIQNINLYTHQFGDPTAGQWVDFLVKWLVFPYLLIMQFTWRTPQPWIPTLCILTTCAIATAREANLVVSCFKGTSPRVLLRRQLWELYFMCRYVVICGVLWMFIPSFLCHFFFWATLYTMAYSEGDALFKQLNPLREMLLG